MKKMNKKGFTLVEIMIVVAIIGLLAAIGIPSFNKARTSSRKTACINNLRLIDSAKQQYAIEASAKNDYEPRSDEISPFIKGTTSSLKCPSGGTTFSDSYTIGQITSNATCQVEVDAHVAN